MFLILKKLDLNNRNTRGFTELNGIFQVSPFSTAVQWPMWIRMDLELSAVASMPESSEMLPVFDLRPVLARVLPS